MNGNKAKLLIGLLLIMFYLWFASLVFAMDFKEYINTLDTKKDIKNELRIEWHNMLGIDIFKGYFAIKDLENTLREYTAINCANFKGRLKFADNYRAIEYKFSLKF